MSRENKRDPKDPLSKDPLSEEEYLGGRYDSVAQPRQTGPLDRVKGFIKRLVNTLGFLSLVTGNGCNITASTAPEPEGETRWEGKFDCKPTGIINKCYWGKFVGFRHSTVSTNTDIDGDGLENAHDGTLCFRYTTWRQAQVPETYKNGGEMCKEVTPRTNKLSQAEAIHWWQEASAPK